MRGALHVCYSFLRWFELASHALMGFGFVIVIVRVHALALLRHLCSHRSGHLLICCQCFRLIVHFQSYVDFIVLFHSPSMFLLVGFYGFFDHSSCPWWTPTAYESLESDCAI